MKRIVVAFLVVPLVPPILLGITMAVWGLTDSFGIDPPSASVALLPVWPVFAVASVFLAFGAITGIAFWWLIRERGTRDA